MKVNEKGDGDTDKSDKETSESRLDKDLNDDAFVDNLDGRDSGMRQR